MVASSLSIAPAQTTAADGAFAGLDKPTWLTRDHIGGVTVNAGTPHCRHRLLGLNGRGA